MTFAFSLRPAAEALSPPIAPVTARAAAFSRTRPPRSVACLALALAVVGITGLSGCGTLEKIPRPSFLHKASPDLSNGRASAENMVRLDAAIRSGCDVVDNIERPPPKQDPRDPSPQRWVARTCHGDISYDVTTVPGANGPSIKVTPVPGPIDRPMNKHFIPAGMDGALSPTGSSSGDRPDSAPDNQPLPSQ
ncbi:hypothetical protein [Robbsia andropogonis]|uniref:hypothetical protein n=1 Tax=Robbsia andropogonis TaxID=28092 RepID=UPI002A6AAAF1|nr:hypothetical protein [Robbsia andropogonis]